MIHFLPASAITRPLRLRSTWRGVAGGLALAAVALVGTDSTVFAATVAHDSDAPVDFSSDHMELQDKQKRVLLTGNVAITQAELRLTADRTLMAYTDVNKVTLQRVDATGHVVVVRGQERASGDVAVYDLNRRLITMVGNVVLHRANGDTLHGGRLVTDLNTGISNIDGHTASAGSVTNGLGQPKTNGRVSGTFNVPKKDSAPK